MKGIPANGEKNVFYEEVITIPTLKDSEEEDTESLDKIYKTINESCSY